MIRKKLGKNQQKFLTLLLAGVSLALCRSPRKQLQILEDIPKELERINLQGLEYGLHKLYKNKYIGLRAIGDNKYVPYLTKEGREKATIASIENVVIPIPKQWDKKWRLVFFDIPERSRKRRKDFRRVLQGMGFKEIQKSVLCYPYPCGEQVMRATEFLFLTRYIRYALATELNNDQKLRQQFNLP